MIPEDMSVGATPVAARPFAIGRAFDRSRAFSPALSWNTASWPAGATVFRDGAFADKVFTVRSGLVKLVTHMPNGRVRILGLHGPGAVLGLVIPTTSCATYHHSAVTVTEAEGEWAPAAQLRRLRRERSEEYLQLVERHCTELRSAERWITEFSGDTTTCRIARVIRYLAELQRLPGTDTVELLTCQEMAEVIGVSTESASRVLARFKRHGLLTPRAADAGSRLYRFDSQRLEEIAFA